MDGHVPHKRIILVFRASGSARLWLRLINRISQATKIDTGDAASLVVVFIPVANSTGLKGVDGTGQAG